MIYSKLIDKKQLVILTASTLFARTIEENFHYVPELLFQNDSSQAENLSEFLVSSSKIDLLILHSEDFAPDEILERYKIKTIVNITNKNQLSKDEIKLSKPLKLNDLLKLIEKIFSSQDIFCAINGEFIYNEELRSLSSKDKSMKLTEKENEIFKSILLSPNFKISKELLLKNIWNYHKDTESLTVDSHLYKLKTKLPTEMLEIKNNVYSLKIIELI